MSLPPDDDNPRDALPGIEEPPVDDENDTRPLKAMRQRPIPTGKQVSEPPPAATILHEAGFELHPLDSLPLASEEDTERVRLVPRLPNPPAWRIIFQIGARPATVGLDVRQALIIGRADADMDELPGLDLTQHNALQNGVSRQHAVLIPSADALFLSDLGSANGTWLNGAYLTPGERFMLSSGDRLELGLLKLVVRTVTVISRSSER